MNTRSAQTPIYLWGMPGVGKSTIGRALAARLGRRFIDLDECIVRASGQKITSLFHNGGEAVFRSWEARCLNEVLQENGAPIVALGGGALLDESRRSRVRERGCLVCLTADTATLMERLAHEQDTRPLLNGESERVHIVQALQEERASAYADCDVEIDTVDRSLDEVISRVLGTLNRECAA